MGASQCLQKKGKPEKQFCLKIKIILTLFNHIGLVVRSFQEKVSWLAGGINSNSIDVFGANAKNGGKCVGAFSPRNVLNAGQQ